MAKSVRDKLKGKKAIVKKVVIPADEASAKRYADAQTELQRSQFLNDADALAKAKAEFEAVEKQVSEAGLVFVFRGIGRPAYEALRLSHKPTDEQKAAQPNAAFNVDTFPAALCARCQVDPEPLTEQEWLTQVFLSEDWNNAELADVFNAAMAANNDSQVVSLGN